MWLRPVADCRRSLRRVSLWAPPSPWTRKKSKVGSIIVGRRLSSSTAADDTRLPLSVHNLGLDNPVLVSTSTLTSIRQLPEMESAWSDLIFSSSATSQSTLDQLQRARDVFAGFAKGGAKHVAVCALLAECQQQLARYEDVLESLEALQELGNSSSSSIQLAKAKVLWTRGKFEPAHELCEDLLLQADSSSALLTASAMNGKALSLLLSASSKEEENDTVIPPEVLDLFRDAVSLLEKDSLVLPQTASMANWGVAEAHNKKSNNAAQTKWTEALQKLTQQSTASQLLLLLQANLHANLAWDMITKDDRTLSQDDIAKASEHASLAIRAHDDSHQKQSQESLCRILTVLATCYHRAGSAVTAEGLFQSATTTTSSMAPLLLLQRHAAYQQYSQLCDQWDKRHGDALRYQQQADDIVDQQLPEAWRAAGIIRQSLLYSSLWFWTPADFFKV
ncbi:expressed unknown protein [Seminavis robusta]|uniref:Uncharacterized protein n=1 Tax=Seminavis robusta TaxID=568900 RepID=A0A9N8DWI2_9STRA|nr:expressed unknown protein [Seminavis robusta]|eukprot:Sro405_g136130.1 n/a (449) ;mRNA; r:32345-33691